MNNSSLEAPQSKKMIGVRIIIVVIFMVSLIGMISGTSYIQSHGQTESSSADDLMAWGRGMRIIVNQNSTLTRITSFPNSLSTNVGILFSNYTSYGNATITGGNATFNLPLIAGEAYLICNIGQTKSAWHDPGAFPYADTYVNFTNSLDCQSSFANQTNVIREFLSITVEPPPVASGYPNITLVSPTNNSNQFSPTSFVIDTSSSNSTFQLTNISFFLDGVLNETISITGTSNSTTISKYLAYDKVHNWTAYVCDNFNCSLMAGNKSFSTKKIFEESQSYNEQGLEGSSQTFKLNVSIAPGYTLSSGNITYNRTTYSSTFLSINSTLYQLTSTFNIPSVSTNTNVSFNWTVKLTDGTNYYVDSRNQTILNLGLDNCVINNVTILNFTLVNEKTQTALNATGDNTSIKVDVKLYTDSAKTTLANYYYHLYNKTIPAAICISEELGASNFYMDAQVEYSANNHQVEFYNIQSYNLNATAHPSQNITLYDLLTTEAQAFKITYKDTSFLAVANALIQIQRKYVDEGVFKTVEIPMTDVNGQTVGNLVLNDVVYSFSIVKNGVLLATFQNIQAVCQNPAITDCTIDLNSFSSSIDVTDFETEKDFAYTVTYDRTTRVITGIFSIPSGATSTVVLNVTKEDALGTSICSESLTTSAGTLTCTVGSNFGNGTVMVKFYRDGVLKSSSLINLEQSPSDIYSGILVLLGVFILITLIGAAMSDDPIYTVLFFLVGVILVYSLNLVAHNGFIGAGASILFLVIAIIIILIKSGRRV